MIYVLIFIMARAGTSFTQEFGDVEACNTARIAVSKTYDGDRVVAVCLPKATR